MGVVINKFGGNVNSRIVMFSIFVGAISFLVGLFGKLTHHMFFVSNATWHEFAQTCLLFAIAWGISEMSYRKIE